MRTQTRGLFLLLMSGMPVVLLSAVGCKDKAPDKPILLNFHTIDEGKAYRSPQLSSEALSYVIDNYGIKTVVNLRGTNLGKPWYDAEAAVCRGKNVALVDHAMSSQALPSPELLEAILATLATAERPLLIHCESGADRTGAVAGLYRKAVLGQDTEAAMQELSPDYWHFRAKKPCMDTLVEMFEPGDNWLTTYTRNFDTLVCRP